jgi:hypothetical protein
MLSWGLSGWIKIFGISWHGALGLIERLVGIRLLILVSLIAFYKYIVRIEKRQ